jgi:Dolichyl-phosphate-mannose-protein mannosyltransferase
MKAFTKSDYAFGAVVPVFYILWLYKTARTLGFSRDESFYFDAAGSYAAWFKRAFEGTKGVFSQAGVDTYWEANHEHPSLIKSLFALSWMTFHEKWHWIEDASTALRLPGMLLGGLGLYLTFLFTTRAAGRTAGVFAALALALMPRIFYHAHLACFDIAAMTMWTLALYAYHRALTVQTWMRAVLAGLAYGLLLETKHNAWLLPGVIVPHAVYLMVRERDAWKRVLKPVLCMATLGPAVFVGLWPWLWNDTLARIQAYAGFHLNHDYYNMEFLGVNYNAAPSPAAYAPVMILATVPTITLLLFALGAFENLVPALVRLVKRATPESEAGASYDALLVLFALSFAVPIAVFFLPRTPIFGGTKHWFPAYPFLAAFAGLGFSSVLSRARGLGRSTTVQAWAPPVLGVALLTAPLVETAHSHPFGLSAYVAMVGGTQGGASLGLNRQFWGFTTQSLAPFFERELRPGATVFIHDTTGGAFQSMQNEKRIRGDIRGTTASIDGADVAIIHHELHMKETEVNAQTAYGVVGPAYILTQDGVPIISVYKKPPSP